MSPTLSAISSAPSSPRLSGCPSPTPSFNGGGRSYARSNVSRHAAYDSFVGASGGNAGLTTNVYIRGLPSSTTDEGLHAMCAAFGNIVSSKAIIDQRTGDCKGYGFVMYAVEDQARVAINAFNAKGFQASFAKESFSTKLKNLQDSNSTNIYVSNLPLDFDEAKLDELFQPYKILSNRILRDTNGVSRGVGFAR
ncbi:hypothetical protein THASP1DRAFT_16838 [Thamnocephalis sphaerospora]|uniref:RRM domain-containing protein n=1 Tax=Thamnocephalis sphaerospora TaxID=78915 RepID=A0A4P9XQ33_9FUNG|nr:hypothetical protein THASP1DRAFT_16838 [Thamnocephalis sphaerospora]|eukprot:RKP07581.1 hypothetical protein THASP1DRAFT_16838 [Thamnocephalis sphaerospora]